MRSSKMSRATSAGSMMLNPRSARSRSSPRQKEMAAGLRVEAWGPVAIASRIVASDQGSPPPQGSPVWRTTEVTLSLGGVCLLGVQICCGVVSRARMCRGRERVVYLPRSPWRGQREGRLAVPWRHARSQVGQCMAPCRETQGKGQSLPLWLDLWL